jgi:hypothetical protein
LSVNRGNRYKLGILLALELSGIIHIRSLHCPEELSRDD